MCASHTKPSARVSLPSECVMELRLCIKLKPLIEASLSLCSRPIQRWQYVECNEVEPRCKYLPNSQINSRVYGFECAAKLCLAAGGWKSTRRPPGDCALLFMRLFVKFAALQDAAFTHTHHTHTHTHTQTGQHTDLHAFVCALTCRRVFCFTARAAKREKQTPRQSALRRKLWDRGLSH